MLETGKTALYFDKGKINIRVVHYNIHAYIQYSFNKVIIIDPSITTLRTMLRSYKIMFNSLTINVLKREHDKTKQKPFDQKSPAYMTLWQKGSG